MSDTQKPFSKHLLKQYIENSHLDIYEAKQIRFIIVNQQNIAVGTIDLFDYNPQHSRAGVGVLIHQQYQKRGYAKQALEILHQYAFLTLNIHQLYANIATDNQKSIKLFEALAYQKTGIKKNWIFSNRQYKDVAFYQIFKSQF